MPLNHSDVFPAKRNSGITRARRRTLGAMSGFCDIGRLPCQHDTGVRSSTQPSNSAKSRGEGRGCRTLVLGRRQLGLARHRNLPSLSCGMLAAKEHMGSGRLDQAAERQRPPFVQRTGSYRSIAPCRSQAEGSSGGSVGEPGARRRSYSAPRPPLQRQRPGPQRPMDSRQAKPQHPSQQQVPQRPSSDQQRVPAAPQQESSVERNQREPGTSVAWNTSSKRPTLVHFCLQYHTSYGQQIRLVGSHENLGMLRTILAPLLLP